MLVSRASVLCLLVGLALLLSVAANVEHEVASTDILDVTCKSDLDIIFLVDGSDAIPDRGWGQLRLWLTSFINVFTISAWQTRVGIIQMGDSARFEIKLSGNATAISQTAESMLLMKSGKTDFRGGLQQASNELLTNLRPGVPRVIVVLTNSDQNTDTGALSVANTLRSQLTDVVVVGIGSEVNSEFLAALATDPLTTYMTTSGFSRLDLIQQSLVVKLCVRLERLEPSSGPTSGGTAVRIFGSGFTPSPGLACYFGTQYSPASFVDSRSIVCRSVAQAYYGQQHLNVSVTPNSVDFTIRNLTFSYEIECPSGCSGRGVCINGNCLCDQGWTGFDCSSPSINTTSPNTTCPNNCNGNNGYCLNGNCQCFYPWHGYDCSLNNTACPNNCNGNGWCNNDTCQCNWGWTGYDCSVNTTFNNCPSNCNGNGWCNNGTCQCFWPWHGFDCSVNTTNNTCPNNCNGNGWCNNGYCQCNFGWTGYDCSVNTTVNNCPSNCNGNGWCNNGTCQCNFGWTGYDCSIFSNTTSCPNNCSSNGYCNFGQCICNMGWSGSDCSYSPCNPPCTGNAYCNFANNTCMCPGGWQGPQCQDPVPCPRNCSGHGTCFSGYCSCDNGWFGDDCSVKGMACPRNCSGNGWCNFNGTCQCYGQFTGKDCSQVIECPQNCSSNGWCSNTGECYCFPGWTGPGCNIPLQTCPNNCSGHGYCSTNHVCLCYAGYHGVDCSQHMYECPRNCSMNGRCDYSTGHCACNMGWTGADCGTHHMKRDVADAQVLIHNDEEEDK